MGRATLGCIVAAALALALGGTASSEDAASGAGARDAGRGACKQDRERLCPDARGGNEMFQCFQRHADDLSPGCRDQLERRRQHREARLEAAQEACTTDIGLHCAKIEPGARRVLQCLRQHESELEDTCRAALPQRKGKGRKAPQRAAPAPPQP